jgi:predicted transport protein
LSDLKLFRVEPNRNVVEIPGSAVALERSLQTLIEQNLEAFLGVQLLASEFSTGPRHGGRVDTLGIDENGCPIIIEYKRATNENVINQGLFYLDWLMDHKAEFKLLVMEKLGVDQAASIDWTAPRLLCIAGDFNRYDEHAVQQINRNIELVRYRRYGDELLLLELVNRKTAEIILDQPDSKSARRGPARDTTVTDYLAQASPALADRYEALKAYLLALGDDVQLKTLKNYFAFRRLKNFACVEVHNRTGGLLVYVKVNPDEVELENGFTRDMRNIGHFGTGDLEIRVSSDADLERAKPLLEKSYEVS